MGDEITFTISGDDGSTDEVTIPAGMLQLLDGDENPSTVVGDLALMGCAERIHAAVHHAHGEVDDALHEAESATMDRFESRFGATYAELTGHSH